jgi:prefoldin beta subunit
MSDNHEKINQLQMYEQSVQNIVLQKQQFQAQSSELDSALSELEKTEKAYKIIGNIMVHTDKKSLKEELESKKIAVDMRIKALEKQENSIKEKASSLQGEVMKNMENEREKN